jgi:hypothetical protein
LGKFKYEDHLETLGLCECLIALIQFEVKQGNKISGYDTHAKWPKEESHLIYLKSLLFKASLYLLLSSSDSAPKVLRSIPRKVSDKSSKMNDSNK